MSAEIDIGVIKKYEAKAPASSVRKKILREALAQVSKVQEYKLLPKNMDQGGSVVPIYDQESKKPKSYILEYCPGKIANLVHELTHVSVAESYQCDLVNYHCPTRTDLEHQISLGGNCSNLAAIQQDWDGKNGSLKAARLKILSTLTAKARDVDFGERKKISYFGDEESGYTAIKSKQSISTEIVTKLEYGMKTPHLEYDSVINHVYMWLVVYGYPKSSFFSSSKYNDQNSFYDSVESAAATAYEDRQNAVMENSLQENVNPLYAPSSSV